MYYQVYKPEPKYSRLQVVAGFLIVILLIAGSSLGN